MPLALVAIGVVLLIASIRGTTDELFALLKADFTGEGNFLLWILAFGAVGAVGYVKPLRPVSTAFLVLLVIVFLLAANKGGKDFFSSLLSQVKNRPITLGTKSDPFLERFTDSSKDSQKTASAIAKVFGF